MAAASGAIGLPTVDDWVYTQGAESLLRNGSISMTGHTAAALGQLVLVQPLLWLSSGEYWAFMAFGVISATLAITFTYLLGREFLGRGPSCFAVLLLIVFPGYQRETASFMTDVPAYMLTALSLWLGTKWLRNRNRQTLVIGCLGAGILAVSIREFAIAAPLAVILSAWIRHDPKDRAWLTGLSICLVAGVAVALTVASGTNRVTPGPAQGSAPLSVAFLGGAFATMCVVLLPAIVLAARDRISRLTTGQFVAASVTGFLIVLSPTGAVIGNYWTANGIGSDLLLAGTREALFGGRVWVLVEQLAIFSSVLLVAMVFGWAGRNLPRVGTTGAARVQAGRSVLSWHAPLPMFLMLYAAELAGYTLFGPILDRYLFPMIPVAAIVLLLGSRKSFGLGRGLSLSHAAFGWLAVTAFLLTANSFAYDAARWREGEAAALVGYDPQTVDAGYEWVGFHATGSAGIRTADFILPWYYDAIPARAPCAVLSNSFLSDSPLKLIRVNNSAYRQYLFFGPDQPLYLYAATSLGCPEPKP